jgi:23S rRNA m(2)G-2445 methyltransferase (EC 2.1.1.52)
MSHNYFATCPKGLESLLKQELESIVSSEVKETVAGCSFDGDLENAYRACLWSRCANKILLPLARGIVKSADDIYALVASVPWEEHFLPDSTLLVDFIGASDAIRHTQFGAQRVKDAVVDRLREQTGERPNVEKSNPDIRINARLAKGQLHLSLDLSGDSLHRRGYRMGQGGAPLKENLAAALLLRAGWTDIAARGGALLDPMCGSATFLIEGVMIAADIAPGIYRADKAHRSRFGAIPNSPKGFGFERWRQHSSEMWQTLIDEAFARREKGLANFNSEVRGYDVVHRVLDAAAENIETAGLADLIRLTPKAVEEFKKPTHTEITAGLVICNPPYGERLGEIDALKATYYSLASVMKRELPGWELAVFTGAKALSDALRLRPRKKYKFYNGAIPSELLLFDLLAATSAPEPANSSATKSGASLYGARSQSSSDATETESNAISPDKSAKNDSESQCVSSSPSVNLNVEGSDQSNPDSDRLGIDSADSASPTAIPTNSPYGHSRDRNNLDEAAEPVQTTPEQIKKSPWAGTRVTADSTADLRPYDPTLDPKTPTELKEFPLSSGAEMVCNRLKKNQKRLEKWLRKSDVNCYRLYDADMPEYSAAVDVYTGSQGDLHIHVQEYAAPKSIEESKAEARFKELVHAVAVACDVSEDVIVLKTRRRNKGKQQYEKLTRWEPSPGEVVTEGQCKFKVNLHDYLDTGLFLDHRPLRMRIADMAKGKKFLNLFCYTATATVHAAVGGASSSVSVDMSNTYLQWARENFDLNNIQPIKHRLIRDNCLTWLDECQETFDLIMLDPPSFSNSKKMEDVLDIQQDHVDLVSRCMDLLNPAGTLFFSNNLRSFKLDYDALAAFDIKDITAQSLDPDFKQNAKIHHCWEVRHPSKG